MFGVFQSTPKNHIFYNFRGRAPGAPPWIRPCRLNIQQVQKKQKPTLHILCHIYKGSPQVQVILADFGPPVQALLCRSSCVGPPVQVLLNRPSCIVPPVQVLLCRPSCIGPPVQALLSRPSCVDPPVYVLLCMPSCVGPPVQVLLCRYSCVGHPVQARLYRSSCVDHPVQALWCFCSQKLLNYLVFQSFNFESLSTSGTRNHNYKGTLRVFQPRVQEITITKEP